MNAIKKIRSDLTVYTARPLVFFWFLQIRINIVFGYILLDWTTLDSIKWSSSNELYLGFFANRDEHDIISLYFIGFALSNVCSINFLSAKRSIRDWFPSVDIEMKLAKNLVITC